MVDDDDNDDDDGSGGVSFVRSPLSDSSVRCDRFLRHLSNCETNRWCECRDCNCLPIMILLRSTSILLG